MSSQIILETEAFEKVCPYRELKCIGSRCMKWEWYYKQVPSNTPTGFVRPPNMARTDKGSCGA